MADSATNLPIRRNSGDDRQDHVLQEEPLEPESVQSDNAAAQGLVSTDAKRSATQDTAKTAGGSLEDKKEEGIETIASDIYRGEPPSQPTVYDAEKESIASTISTTPSLQLNVGRRLGALALSVEAAISRWARAHSTNSSVASSSSSASSTSAATRTTTTRRRRGRRYSDSASEINAARERAIIARKKAREEFRAVPREFTLLLPTEHVSGLSKSFHDASRRLHFVDTAHEQVLKRRTVRTASMPLIISQLEIALKKSAKWRRVEEMVKGIDGSCPKGKNRVDSMDSRYSTGTSNSAFSKFTATEKGWWLDVASPTGDDMRSLGKLLHIHPLTLEDILHQDPREKLEIFPKLGYYFVVFRALEGERARERFRRFSSQDSDSASSISKSTTDEGSIGAVNLYLVVFKEGICTFHFDDTSEHMNRMRNKIVSLEDAFHMTSDWIAHGLLDSIVDSFFPYLVSIGKEVKELEALVLQDSSRAQAKEVVQVEVLHVDGDDGLEPRNSQGNASAKKESPTGSKPSISDPEKIDEKREVHDSRIGSWTLRFPVFHVALWITACPSLLKRYASFLVTVFWLRTAKKRSKKTKIIVLKSSATRTLHRMAATRRLVTSLDRLLSAKGNVIVQLRKRLLKTSGAASPATGLGPGVLDRSEIEIYMGDIQDHIITLQQSLLHYEHVLNDAHPTYLSRLGRKQSQTKQALDCLLVLLGSITVTISTIQIPIGIFSINAGNVPKSPFGSNDYTAFGIFLGAAACLAAAIVSLILYWKMDAKKRYSRRRV